MAGMATVRTPGVFEGYSGKLGSLVFRRSAYGTQMLERQRPKQPNTPAQVAARERLSRAGKAWKALSLDEVAEWRLYARTLGRDPKGFRMDPNNVFSRLALKVLQVNPEAEIPTLPPATPFSGDGIAASVVAAPGAVVLNIQVGNAPGVVTEVLVQRVSSLHCAAYPEKFRSRGFSAWTAGGSVSVPVSAGVWAVAVRAVRSATGQSGELMEIGRVAIG